MKRVHSCCSHTIQTPVLRQTSERPFPLNLSQQGNSMMKNRGLESVTEEEPVLDIKSQESE